MERILAWDFERVIISHGELYHPATPGKSSGTPGGRFSHEEQRRVDKPGSPPAGGGRKGGLRPGVASVAFRSRASAKPCNDRLVMSQTRSTARSDRATVVVVQHRQPRRSRRGTKPFLLAGGGAPGEQHGCKPLDGCARRDSGRSSLGCARPFQNASRPLRSSRRLRLRTSRIMTYAPPPAWTTSRVRPVTISASYSSG